MKRIVIIVLLIFLLVACSPNNTIKSIKMNVPTATIYLLCDQQSIWDLYKYYYDTSGEVLAAIENATQIDTNKNTYSKALDVGDLLENTSKMNVPSCAREMHDLYISYLTYKKDALVQLSKGEPEFSKLAIDTSNKAGEKAKQYQDELQRLIKCAPNCE